MAAWSQDRRTRLLFGAFDCIEGAESDPPRGGDPRDDLNAWAREHSGTISDDVVVVEDVEDSHRGKRLLNLGSPLYGAVVRDIPEAVRILLAHGADPNYAHPSHGDTALLHCAERGYDACLRVLLEDSPRARIDPSLHVTADRRFMLGQGLPQYEEGGLNPLSVAVRSGRVEVVKLLLSSCPPRWTGHWIRQTDAVGRTVLQNVFDYIALADGSSEKRKNLKDIAVLLAEAAALRDGSKSNESSFFEQRPTREEAFERLKLRNAAVRERCLKADRVRQERERNRGLQAVVDHYTPRHPEVYSVESVKKACQPPMEVSSPSSEVSEPIPGVFIFPLVDPQFCGAIWEEIHNYERAASSDPKLGLPLRVRHDGNIGDLQDCGFEPLLGAIAELCRPIFLRCLSPDGDGSGDCSREGDREVEAYHAFLTRNYVGREGNATFRMHRDKSLLTVNVCLHASDDFEGSTVGFYGPRRGGGSGEGGRSGERGGGADPPPGDEDRIYTYAHEVGRAVVHSGGAWHRTDPITNGTRGSLIIWLRRKPVA